MFYIRISLMIPSPGRAAQAGRVLDEVVNYCGGQPGYLGGYRLEPDPETGMIGRVTLWEAQHWADRVARSAHMLVLRSELNRAVVPGSHEERGFEAQRAPVALTADPDEHAAAVLLAESILREATRPGEALPGQALPGGPLEG